jgi:hypothetical protein
VAAATAVVVAVAPVVAVVERRVWRLRCLAGGRRLLFVVGRRCQSVSPPRRPSLRQAIFSHKSAIQTALYMTRTPWLPARKHPIC